VTDRRPISPRQRRILDVIEGHVRDHGYPPSLREIGAAVGLSSSSSVAHQIRVLESRGWIRVNGTGQPRSLTIVTDPEPDAVVIDRLAAEIRRADGNAVLGAGALAEALLPWVKDYASGILR